MFYQRTLETPSLFASHSGLVHHHPLPGGLILVVTAAQAVVGIALHAVEHHPATVVNGDAEIFLRARMTAENAIMRGAIMTALEALRIENVGLLKMTMTDMVIERMAQMGMIGKVRALQF